MKAILINGSPHAKGCTYTALRTVADELEKAGVEAEIIHVGHKDIRGCIGCGKCAELGRCVFDDDMVNEVARKFEVADAMIVGSPVYYAGASGTLTAFLNRLFYSTPFPKRMKVGAAVASARRAGTTVTLDQLNRYFQICEMPVASSRYWNEVHGNTAEQVVQDEEGMQTMRTLAANMAFLIQAKQKALESGLEQPVYEQSVFTNFIR